MSKKTSVMDTVKVGMRLVEVGMRFFKDFDKMKRGVGSIGKTLGLGSKEQVPAKETKKEVEKDAEPSKAKMVSDALVKMGFNRGDANKGVASLGESVETNPLEVSLKEALAAIVAEKKQ